MNDSQQQRLAGLRQRYGVQAWEMRGSIVAALDGDGDVWAIGPDGDFWCLGADESEIRVEAGA